MRKRWPELFRIFSGPTAAGMLFNIFYQFAAFFQLATYTTIAFNRWSALVRPLRYQLVRHFLLTELYCIVFIYVQNT